MKKPLTSFKIGFIIFNHRATKRRKPVNPPTPTTTLVTSYTFRCLKTNGPIPRKLRETLMEVGQNMVQNGWTIASLKKPGFLEFIGVVVIARRCKGKKNPRVGILLRAVVVTITGRTVRTSFLLVPS